MNYFSDRERGPTPRVQNEIDHQAWGGIAAYIESLVASGGLAVDYPDVCPDGRGPFGTDSRSLGLAVRAEIPELEWPLQTDELPPALAILDLIEFCHAHVAQPEQLSYHDYFGHHHLSFRREPGQQAFRDRINRIFARSGLAYELRGDGWIVRLAAPTLHEALQSLVIDTGDATLNELLTSARSRFLNPDQQMRGEAVEKLWDAWERLKTLEPAKDKKTAVTLLLDKVSLEPRFRDLLEAEARSLTDAGNQFLIRHKETSQTPLQDPIHGEYLFHRLFALIWLVLRSRQRSPAP